MFTRVWVSSLLCLVGLSVAQTPGDASLFQAIRQSDAAAVKRSLDRGARADSKDAEGVPALMAAALFGNTDCLKVLLDHGANPNAGNAVGATPLMWAIPDLAKVRILLERGADVNARSANLDRTPLLIAASYPGTVEILKLFHGKGANLHAKDRGGMHALGKAV